MVAEDLPGATDALLTGNNEVRQVLAEREQVIDALYTEIEELVNREILLQAPVAADLRFLLSVLQSCRAQRSHDLVLHIAPRADHILGEELSPRGQGLVERMGNLASEMWRQAVDSWYQRDRSVALILDGRDNEMDEAAFQLARRTRLWADDTTGHNGDDTGSAPLRASWRPRGERPGEIASPIPSPWLA